MQYKKSKVVCISHQLYRIKSLETYVVYKIKTIIIALYLGRMDDSVFIYFILFISFNQRGIFTTVLYRTINSNRFETREKMKKVFVLKLVKIFLQIYNI